MPETPKTTTMYMHTIDGHPAMFDAALRQIRRVYQHQHAPARLCQTTAMLRRERAAHAKKFGAADAMRIGFVRVEVPCAR